MRPSRYAFPAALLCAAGLSIGLCFCVITSNTTFSCSSVSAFISSSMDSMRVTSGISFFTSRSERVPKIF